MSEEGVFVATEQFAEVVKGAKVIQVHPEACIPFIRVRGVVKSGVMRLKFSYSEQEDSGLTSGVVSGGFLPTVLELKGALYRHVIVHLMSEFGLNEQEAEEKGKSRETWFGVVDGCHRLHALFELLEENPERWLGFRWSVMLLAPGQPVSVLRAFARGQNLRQSDDRFVETTLYDLLKGLKEEMKVLSRELGGRLPSCKELAESYSASSDRTSSTLRSLALLALRLSDEVVETIGEITNSEDPHRACSFYYMRGKTQYTPENVARFADCRVYRHFLTASSLRQATSFMRTKLPENDVARINTLYCLKECSRLEGYKSVSYRVVEEQYSKAAAALKEGKKFESLLLSSKWPRGMEKIQENLLRNIVLDDEVERNSENDADILPPLLQQFRCSCAEKAPLLEARYLASLTRAPLRNEEVMDDEQGKQTFNAENSENANREHGIAQQDCNDTNNNPASDDKIDEVCLDERKATEKLAQLGVQCFQMSWQQYNQSHDDYDDHTTSDALFDLIITEPPNAVRSGASRMLRSADECIDKLEMEEFVGFSKRVLVSGGYVIVFTAARNWREWVKLFRSHDFSVVDYPFVVVQSTRGLQRTTLLMFPQNICCFAVMAVTPGKHPRGFKPTFEAQYSLFPCSYGRKFAVLDNARTVKGKLRFEDSRAPVRTSEQNPDVLAELMVTFSPEGGRILDPYSGTMSIGAACMATRRSCVLIEKDPKCYQLAFERLCLWSESYTNCTENESPLRRRKTVASKRGMSLDSDTTESVEATIEELLGNAPESSPLNNSQGLSLDTATTDSVEATVKELLAPGAAPEASTQRTAESSFASQEQCKELELNGTPDCLLQERYVQSDTYDLLIGGEVVGRARVQKDLEGTESGWRTILHGCALSDFAKDDEFLVVIWQVKVHESCKHYRYPYSYGGVESPVQTLGDMANGFFAWDMNATAPVFP